jgi:hypothetical protein
MGTCASCRHWKIVSEAEDCRDGVCQNLSHSSWHGGWQLTDAANTCEQWTEIAYYQSSDGAMHVERRIAARASVDFPARLQTPGGTRNVRLADLSGTGARVEVNDPPKAGIVALIQIGPHEMFCRIAWSGGGHCGVSFEKPLPRELVAAITGKAPGFQAPAAIPARTTPQRRTFGLRGVAQSLRAMAKP